MKSKIALCFLTYGNLSQPKIWNQFRDSNKFTIYLHNKNDFNCEYQFNRCSIPNRVKTRWGKISLIRATLELFKEAYKNTDNQYFILLSDTCIPLYKPAVIYKKVHKFNGNVIYNKFFKGKEKLKRYETIIDKDFLKPDDFLKQSQWVLLNRETVKFLIERDYTDKFGDKAKFPDEHYFISLFQKFNIDYINREITFVDWSLTKIRGNCKRHPVTFKELTNKKVKSITQSSNNYLFMRKVDKDCVLPSYFEK